MRVPWFELVLTLALAAAFAALGEIVLRRRSEDVTEANEAMLAGMSVAAAALFLLSVAVPRHALVAEVVILGASLAAAVAVRVLRKTPRGTRRVPTSDPIAVAALVATGLVAAGFVALNFRYQFLWDGFLIWATKAELLFHAGSLPREWFANDVYDLRHLTYPPLVPLFEALIGQLRGGFDFDRLKPVFLVFYLSLLWSTYAAGRAVLSQRFAAVATLLVALVPALSTKYAAGAYADMPQAALVAGALAAALAGRERALPWLIGGLTTVKSEGTILGGLACLAVFVYWMLESPRHLRRRIAAARMGIGIVAAFLFLRIAFVRWVGAPEVVYLESLSTGLRRIPEVVRGCLAEIVDFHQWGLFWLAFAAAVVVLAFRGSRLERTLAGAAVAGLGILMVPFLFTNWPLALQISQAYSRLAAQLAPAGAIVLALGYARAAERDRARRTSADPVLR